MTIPARQPDWADDEARALFVEWCAPIKPVGIDKRLAGLIAEALRDERRAAEMRGAERMKAQAMAAIDGVVGHGGSYYREVINVLPADPAATQESK